MTKRSWLMSTALLLTACGGREQQEERETQIFDAQQEAAPSSQSEAAMADVAAPPPPPSIPMAASRDASAAPEAPRITPTAAPGVAFNYRYAFRLPAERVGAVQEAHAQACERLGVARCRITGMRYRLVGERDVEAMLAFKLDPAIARGFGKAGVEAVTRADGMLVDSEISGVDVGSSISAATRSIAQLHEDLDRVEAQLARAGARSGERSELLYQAQQLRDRIRANRASREANQESLATTPMIFQYGSGDLVPGFETRAPFQRALADAGSSLVAGAGTILFLLASLFPWALLLGSFWWMARRFGLLRWDRYDPRAEKGIAA